MASYYRRIKGKNYDRELIGLADGAIEGRGDGRISLRDAQALLRAVKDADTYTDVEKRTMRYIRDKYKFTKESDKWFRTEIRRWAALKKGGAASPAPKSKLRKKAKRAKAKPKKKKQAKAKRSRSKKHDGAEAAAVAAAAAIDVSAPSPVLMQHEEEAAASGPNYYKALIVIPILILAFLANYLINEYSPSDTPATDDAAAAVKKGKKAKAPAPEKDTGLNEEQVEAIVVNFRRGSHRISKRAKRQVNKVVAYLRENPDDELLIVGHTCKLGGPKINKPLSLFRAKRVAKYLIAAGAPKAQIKTSGEGQKNPIASNKTRKGRRKNRRVEFRLND